jgi:hypothetical protein
MYESEVPIFEAIQGLADASLQRRSWFGHGPEVTSPAESIDDAFSAGFDTYFEINRKRMTDEEAAGFVALLDVVKTCEVGESDLQEMEDTFQSVDWQQIRALAARALLIMTRLNPSLAS